VPVRRRSRRPFPFNDVDLPAANWGGRRRHDFTPSASYAAQLANETTGYFTTTGTLPTGLLPNTIYCASWDRTHVRIRHRLLAGCFRGLTNGADGTHTLSSDSCAAALWVVVHGAGMTGATPTSRHGRWTRPIQVKGNPV